MLTFRDIAHTYSDRGGAETPALRGVSFSAAPGEITALVGPNGSGKSTLFKLVTGLLPVRHGAITLDQAPLRRTRMGVVFQSPSLDPQLTVFENIRHHAMLYGRRLRKDTLPPQLLTRLDIVDKLDTRVQVLSGGYQRRVELAKALLTEPELLVLDEPFTGLDVAARETFFTQVREIAQDRDLVALLITHALDIATLCDRVAVLERGALIADDRPDRLLAEFGTSVVEITTPDADALENASRERGHRRMLRLREQTLLLPDAGIADVQTLLEGRDASTYDIQVRRPTLEDYFIARTGYAPEAPKEELLAA